MKEYTDSIKYIEQQLSRMCSEGKNVIIIGENSVGKSDILRNMVVAGLEKKNAIYYIDSVNRKFNIQNVKIRHMSKTEDGIYLVDAIWDNTTENLINAIEDIVRTRIAEINFNLLDTFNAGFEPENLYSYYKEHIQMLLEEFTGDKIEIQRKKIERINRDKNILLINEKEVLLSNGYQAILRLFIELLYCQEVLKQRNQENGIVVIDEIDKYLSPFYTANILPFIQEKFPEFTLCVTTHSQDLLKYASDYILCPLEQNDNGKVCCEFWTFEDIKSKQKVETVFSDLFFGDERQVTSSNDEIDTSLRRLLNLKLMDSWDDYCEQELEELSKYDLAPHQELIFHRIKGL